MPDLLPPDRRVCRSKVEEYLLNPINGRGKAAFFQAFGFSLAGCEELRDALIDHARSGLLTAGTCRLKAPATLRCRWCGRPGS